MATEAVLTKIIEDVIGVRGITAIPALLTSAVTHCTWVQS